MDLKLKRYNKKISVLVVILMLLFVVQGCTSDIPSAKDEGLNKPGDVEANDQEKDISEDEDNSSDDVDKMEDEEGKDPENTVYISADRLNVREEPSPEGEKIGDLMKGSGVEILGEKTIEEDESKWFNISYPDGDQTIHGWISAEFTVGDRTELLSDDLKALDYSPQEKAEEYTGNPRVKTKGVYLTLYSASGSRLDSLIEMTKNTDINAFVIDVKDDNGNMLFHTQAADKYAPKANESVPIKDIEALMKKLKENDIYTIARIVTFKDPIYTEKHPERAILDKRTGSAHKQQDGLRWASAYDRELWAYDVEVAKEAARAGFNEIQFDYVRLPDSGGGKLDVHLDYRNVNNESKPEVIQNFLKYAYGELSKENVYVAADIYGLVGSVNDDMGLGQYWEGISNVVDYVSPMMYPSHYANNTYNLSVPDAFPYDTIYNSTKDALMRNENVATPATIKPWIQDFTASWVKGHIKYGEKEVRDQIKALEDLGIDEYLLWNSGNSYTEEALTK
ncbi:MAG TPA: putative glycoside hydrolase [Clostridia bacterium]|nr:putative glycoside hydrolase [Clostridia bacterium]